MIKARLKVRFLLPWQLSGKGRTSAPTAVFLAQGPAVQWVMGSERMKHFEMYRSIRDLPRPSFIVGTEPSAPPILLAPQGVPLGSERLLKAF